ncbi:MAG: family transporter [Phycisphaerales bacterium]|nr:family transporter [Phycisphaerales bacterium]
MTEESPRSGRWTFAVVAAAFALFLAYLLRYVLLPFVAAGALAYVATPLIGWVQKRFRLPRWGAAMAPFALVLGGLAVLGLVIRTMVIPQMISLVGHLPSRIEAFLRTLTGSDQIQVFDKTYSVHDLAQHLIGSLSSATASGDPLSGVGMFIGGIMGLILTVVLLFYFLVDGPRIARGVLWVVPPSIRPEALAVGRRAGPMIFNYVRGVIVVVLYGTIVTWLVTQFLLHLPNAFLLAVAVGLLELVPMIGPVLSTALIGLMAVEQQTFWGIMGFALFATGLRVSIDQFVGPVVLGKAVSLPPPVIIFAFLAGGAIYGVLGVVIAIPLAAVIKIILEEAYGGAGEEPEASLR